MSMAPLASVVFTAGAPPSRKVAAAATTASTLVRGSLKTVIPWLPSMIDWTDSWSASWPVT